MSEAIKSLVKRLRNFVVKTIVPIFDTKTGEFSGTYSEDIQVIPLDVFSDKEKGAFFYVLDSDARTAEWSEHMDIIANIFKGNKKQLASLEWSLTPVKTGRKDKDGQELPDYEEAFEQKTYTWKELVKRGKDEAKFKRDKAPRSVQVKATSVDRKGFIV